MKKSFLIITFSWMFINCWGQINNDSIVLPSKNVCGVDLETAHYPGGFSEMNNFIINNFHFPDSVTYTNLDFRIILKITIDTTGTLTNISVLKGISQSIDNEMLRVFSLMPRWIPGVQGGRKVPEVFALPIKFDFNAKTEIN